MKTTLLHLILALFLTGCSVFQTITPPVVKAHTSSFDSSTPVQYADKTNSGLLKMVSDTHKNVIGAMVTDHFLDYVMMLIKDYGDQLAPPIKSVSERKDVPGVRPVKDEHGNDIWFVDTEHFDHYRQLARWKKNNREKMGVVGKLINSL